MLTTIAGIIVTGLAMEILCRRRMSVQARAHELEAEMVREACQMLRDKDVASTAAIRALNRMLEESRAERDRFSTALRGELTRQARAESASPDDIVGHGSVLTRSAR